ncbi:uncharacterized protein LOC130673511 [Microplitis mediator]|uniref:uncharacterized protein LOC130673511 n=1 Tax=Microplitis mediator TaxID=375433 RepID=UPI002554B7E0|nr:uncharacterized protein LOC130673511 [Microplitis mediator]
MIFYSVFYFFGSLYNLLILLDYSQFKYHEDDYFFYQEILLTFGVISYNMMAFSSVIKDYNSSMDHPLIDDYVYIIRSLGSDTTDSPNGYLFTQNLSDRIFLLITFLAGMFSLTSIRNPYWDVSVYFNLYIVISYLPALVFTSKKLLRTSEIIENIDRKINELETIRPDRKRACEESITGIINELNVVNIKICTYWNGTSDIYENSILVASIHLITKLTLFSTYTIKAYFTEGRCSSKANLELIDVFLLLIFFLCRAVYFFIIEDQIHSIKKTVEEILKKSGKNSVRVEAALQEFSHTHKSVYSIPDVPRPFFERMRRFIWTSEVNQSPIDANILKDISILTLSLFIVIMTTKVLLAVPTLRANDLCNLYELPNTYIQKVKWFLLLLFVKLNVLERFCDRLSNNHAFGVITYVLIFFLFHVNSYYNL